jgi:hypothetical protein
MEEAGRTLRVVVRFYPFECWCDLDYNMHTPYYLVPKLFSGALGDAMPREVDQLIENKFFETETGKKVKEVADIASMVVLKNPVVIELTAEETLNVVKLILDALARHGWRARVTGFRELGLEELAKKHNASLKNKK